MADQTEVQVPVPVKDGTVNVNENAVQESSRDTTRDFASDFGLDRDQSGRNDHDDSHVENGSEPDLATINRIYRCVIIFFFPCLFNYCR